VDAVDAEAGVGDQVVLAEDAVVALLVVEGEVVEVVVAAEVEDGALLDGDGGVDECAGFAAELFHLALEAFDFAGSGGLGEGGGSEDGEEAEQEWGAEAS
jgi:hypothetical protein